MDTVDIYDNAAKKWINATVVKENESKNTNNQFFTFGLRQYQEDGDKEDQFGKYFGFSDTCNVACAPHSIRVQKINSMT